MCWNCTKIYQIGRAMLLNNSSPITLIILLLTGAFIVLPLGCMGQPTGLLHIDNLPKVSSNLNIAVWEYLVRNTSGSSLVGANKKKDKLKYWCSWVIKYHHRGSIQATVHPLAIILTAALWALISTYIYIYKE